MSRSSPEQSIKNELSEEEYAKHLTELSKEMKMKKPSTSHVEVFSHHHGVYIPHYHGVYIPHHHGVYIPHHHGVYISLKVNRISKCYTGQYTFIIISFIVVFNHSIFLSQTETPSRRESISHVRIFYSSLPACVRNHRWGLIPYPLLFSFTKQLLVG